MSPRWDVVVVGGGNAGSSAALAARERGASVLLLEKAPREWAGGNSSFTAGAMRTAHHGLADLRQLIESDQRLARTDLDPYSADDFRADLVRVTRGRTDATLADIWSGSRAR